MNSAKRSVDLQDLPTLHPDGVPISQKKYENLQDLLKYILSVHHHIYTNLHHDGNTDNTQLFPDDEAI